MEFYDVTSELDIGVGGEFFIKRQQEIPDWYLKHLADERFDSMHTRAGELHRVASVPVAIVERWKHEGFDIYQASIHEIIARLKKEGLDGLMATAKRI